MSAKRRKPENPRVDEANRSPQQNTAETIQDLINAVKRLRFGGEGWLFRGQPNKSFALLPKAGRPPFDHVDDLALFEEWRRKAVAYLPTLAADDWEALAVAQHHGLATRYLDWTFGYTIATYFAVREQPDVDGAVYCYQPPSFDQPPRPKLRSVKSVSMYSPPLSIPRLVNQQGVFTCHPRPKEPLVCDPKSLVTIVVPAVAKSPMRKDLDALGVNEASLFPDLDGLARHMNWRVGLDHESRLSHVLDSVMSKLSNREHMEAFLSIARQRSGE